MSTLIVFTVLFAIHFLADFMLQTDWMAKGKSKSLLPLLVHITIYSVCFIPLFGWKFAAVNGALHMVIDFFSSRASSYLFKKNDIHNAFVVIGFDQLLHILCLMWTLYFMSMNGWM